jgi:GPI-anchor transamidase subunit U
MTPKQQRLAIYAGAALLRLLVFFTITSIPDFLTSQVEISTPVSSFKRLQEGLFLYRRGVSPYDGGLFHQAPLLLVIFELIPWPGVIFTILDLVNALALEQITESGESVATRLFKSPRADDRFEATAIAAAYLLNPFTIVACLGRSTTAFTNAAIIQGISSAVQGRAVQTTLALALATYFSMYPVLLLPPLLLLCWDRSSQSSKSASSFIAQCLGQFTSGLVALFFSTPLILGNAWTFAGATYGTQFSVPDLTPNIGLWWYFFIEIFDSFRNYYIGVFWLHIGSYVGGLTLRLRQQPLFVLTTMLGLLAIFKPYPSISDVSLYLAFVPLYKHIFPRESIILVSLQPLLTSSSDAVQLYHSISVALCDASWSCFSLPMDICRFRERQLLLCHHVGVEPRVDDAGGRFAVRRAAR